MPDFTIKRGDSRPALRATLTETVLGASTPTPIDLTTATSVYLLMKLQGASSTTVNAACSFVDRAAGIVQYAWNTTDTVSPGLFDVEFEITWSDGGKETVPNDAPAGHTVPYYQVQIVQDLA